MSVKTVQQQVECIVSELEAILPHFKTSTVSYAKQKLEKVIAKLKMKPHPEPNSYFEPKGICELWDEYTL